MTSIPTVEDFNRISAGLEALRAQLDVVLSRIGAPKVVKVADIARMEGVSRSQISGKEAYLLPNFGVSEYPDGVVRWDFTTYLKWREIPVEKRRSMYVDWLEQKRKAQLQI